MADGYGATAKTLGKGRLAPMDADAVRDAYRRWAENYDNWFGLISAPARRGAVAAVNRAPGSKVLEVGVGTGLALPQYRPEKHVTGIDLSAEMLRLARLRVADLGLPNIDGLHEMDAQNTSFATGQFDIAVAMFVASVVPDPRALVRELRRVVRPGGTILFVNHFAAKRGPVWWVERALAPASAKLGWHPDFRLNHMLDAADLATARVRAMQPCSLFRLVELDN
jgi:phosphatidylethanolamine/phosphatidyl-N-methylethanolamine N-methyltransferase